MKLLEIKVLKNKLFFKWAPKYQRSYFMHSHLQNPAFPTGQGSQLSYTLLLHLPSVYTPHRSLPCSPEYLAWYLLCSWVLFFSLLSVQHCCLSSSPLLWHTEPGPAFSIASLQVSRGCYEAPLLLNMLRFFVLGSPKLGRLLQMQPNEWWVKASDWFPLPTDCAPVNAAQGAVEFPESPVNPSCLGPSEQQPYPHPYQLLPPVHHHPLTTSMCSATSSWPPIQAWGWTGLVQADTVVLTCYWHPTGDPLPVTAMQFLWISGYYKAYITTPSPWILNLHHIWRYGYFSLYQHLHGSQYLPLYRNASINGRSSLSSQRSL